MTFGAHLAAERSARGLSKRALALRAGVSPAYVTLLEQDRRTPARGVAAALAAALAGTTPAGGAPGDPELGRRLLAAAGYLGEPALAAHSVAAPAKDDRPGAAFHAPAALAAALADPDIPRAARAVLDDLVCDVVATLHRTARHAGTLSLRDGGGRATLLTLLARREEEQVQKALDDYRSPMYDL